MEVGVTAGAGPAVGGADERCVPKDLLDVVFSWSLDDIFNEDLYKHKVGVIPQNFQSVKQYLWSFVFPLLEETRVDFCSNLEKISDAPYSEIISIKECTKLFYKLKVDCWKKDLAGGKGMYRPSHGDVLVISDVKPECVSDLNRYGGVYTFALITELDDDGESLTDFKVNLSKDINVDGNMGKSLYAIFLLNITSNKRIWKALGRGYGLTSHMSIIKKVLRVGSLADGPCDLCPSETSDTWARRFPKLNDSQVGAILGSISTAQCNHRCSVSLIWGPPGTGKTQTVSELLWTLSSMNYRVLTCTPTNVAISEITSRVLKLVKDRQITERGRISCYSLGDIVLFGNKDRLKIDDDLREIFLDYRVHRLLECLSPLYGWKHHVASMINFLEGCVSLYDTHVEKEKELKKASTMFVDFVIESYTSIAFSLRAHVVCLCTHLTTGTISKANLENLVNLLNLLEDFGSLLSRSDIREKELKKTFMLIKRASDANFTSADEIGSGSIESSTTVALYRTGNKCLYILKSLRNNLNTPSFRVNEKDEAQFFCLESASLIFCTASTSFRLFYKKSSVELKPIDLLCIDEASQLKESESTIPLQLRGIRHAILVGDECQLPATVKSKASENAGFGRSLFERLSSLGHPKHLLEIQYRMHPSISLFPNTEFYSGKILDAPNVKCNSYEKCYLPGSMYGPYSFINVVDGKEELDDVGHSRKNMVEVGVILQIVRSLFKVWSAVKQRLSIGIVSPYAAQVCAIQEKLGRYYEMHSDFLVKVKSVDGFQGGEEDLIIISTVRSNGSGSVGFLSSRQRANVALTRARHCLWIVGNGATLVRSGSVWEPLVCDAKYRRCFFDASEDKNLARAILRVKEDMDQMDDLLNKDSVLFRNAIWRVLFSDDFKKSFAQIRSSQTKKGVIHFLLKLASGWRPKKYFDSVDESSQQLLKQYKVEGLYIICTTDITKISTYAQVLKIWDILPLSEIPKLVERLNSIMMTYSDKYIDLCKSRCFDGNLEVPVCWVSDLDFVKYKTLSTGVTSEGSEDRESDGRNFVENSKVTESLLLMKFYSLSSGVVGHLLSGHDGKELDLPFEVSDQELETITYPKSSFILGRSGTGKTTVLTMKLIQKEQQWYLSSDGFNISPNDLSNIPCKQMKELVNYEVGKENILRQMFVTVSPKLCSAIKNHIIRLKSFTCGGNFSQRASFDMYDIGDSLTAFADIADSFHNIPSTHYPLVITFEKFLMMLDGSVGNSFFEKFHDYSAPFLDKTGMSRSVALQSIMRQREVTYARFTSLYWPHFNAQLTKKLDSATVFTEIISRIKGGLADGESLDYKLSREAYCKLSEGRSSTLNSDERDIIYDMFLDYEKKKLMNGEFDLSDLVIDLHRRLKVDGGQVGRKIDFVYVDEVQDLSMRQIALFRYVCNNFDEGFVFAGDTAQTIARGIDFRFQDIRSLFYNEFHSGSRYDPLTSSKGRDKHISDIFHLNQNFRTHDGVLKLAQSVVDILYSFFPHSIDRLSPETSPIFGESPVLLESGNDQDAIMTIFGNRGDNAASDCSSGFGAEQVILVRDDNSKREISEHVKKQALVLTIFECKGLEFQDVLLYNFFRDSPLKTQLRVIYDYMNSRNLLDSSTRSFPSFEMTRHKILCSELKQLYVAITRTRQRLWICEGIDEYSKPMFDYWKKLCLVRVRRLDTSVAQAMCVASSKEEWQIRGIKLFNEGNFEMATMCFERAADSFREKWARASGLRASADHVLHSNFEMARILLTEAAEIYETIGKVESAASCYMELKEFKKAGSIYWEKCGESRLEDAGDCFCMAGCWSLAAEVYAKGGYFSKCLSVCSKGNMFDIGLRLIDCWKGSASSVGFDESSQALEKMKDSFVEKCALHYHKLKDRNNMMKFVQAFSSMEYARAFLKLRGYLDELVAMEEKLGNFLEAAAIARMKHDMLLEANMLEKAGHFEEASRLILLHVTVNSLWTSGSNGWPMKQFIGKENLLEKAKNLAERTSDDFFQYVCVETKILAGGENSLADLVDILNTARRLENMTAEIFSARKALDMHLHLDASKLDPSKLPWKSEVNPQKQIHKMLLPNQFCSETLMYMWNILKQNISNVLDNLSWCRIQAETEHVRCWNFCLEYLGVQEMADQQYVVFNSEACWIKENSVKYLQRDGKLALDAQQFTSAAINYWSSELFSVGLEVLATLTALDKFVIRRPLSPVCRGTVLLHLFEVSKFLLDSDHFCTKSHIKPLQALASSKWCFFDIVFPIDWRLVSSESMITLRENVLAKQMLKEILVQCVNRSSGKLTYGKLGKVVMLLFATGTLDEELYQAIENHFKSMPLWKMFIEQLRVNEAGKFILAMNLRDALKCTFEINWCKEADYISPHCFLYLVERLLFLLSSCRGYFFTTKAYLVEALGCPDRVAPSTIDAGNQTTLAQSFDFLGNMIGQLLFDKDGTLQWVKKSKANVSECYPLLVLRLFVISSLIYLNSKLHFQAISSSLRRKEIFSDLPPLFYNCLQNVRMDSFHDKFAGALVAVHDPLVVVSSENNDPKFSCSNALFINMNATWCRGDVLEILFPKNPGFPDQTDALVPECEGSRNVDSSNGTGQGNDIVHPSVSSAKDSEPEDCSLQKSYECLCATFDTFLSEYQKDKDPDRIASDAPRVKSDVEEFILVFHHAMSCLNQDDLHDADEVLLGEAQTLIDDLKRLCLTLNVSEKQQESSSAMVEELLDRVQGGKLRMEAFLLMLKGFPNTCAETAAVAAASGPHDRGIEGRSNKPKQKPQRQKRSKNKKKR